MNNGKKTIFLVDDNMTNLVIGRNALSAVYNIYTFDSGMRLLLMLGKMIPDLILLDVRMPEMDGYELMRIIKSKPETAHIPVIFLTALSNEDTELQGLSMGAVDYIVKPFSVPLLLKRIELHLLMEEQKRELLNYSTGLEAMIKEKIGEAMEQKNLVLKAITEIVDCRDELSGGHVDRIQRYLHILIEAMKEHGVYTKEVEALDVDLVLQSSALHDVGKIWISDAILLKPGKLTAEEFEEMKAHTNMGEQIIRHISEKTGKSEYLEYARTFAASHHEKWNGQGYPRGLKENQIPLLGRIIAIADVYDALTTERPYKKALSHDKAIETITKESGQHFDPSLINLIPNISEKFLEHFR